MRELIDAFFRERSIVNHHIASFNDFLPTIDNPNSRMQRIVDNLRSSPEDERRGIIKLDEDRTEGDVIEIRIGRKRDDRGRIDLEAKPTITLGLPVVKEANGATHPLNPMEARLRNLNYTAPIYLDFTVIENGIEREPERVHIGNFPIMVKSKRCLLYKENMETEGELTIDEYRRKLIEDTQEDPYDPGGYFIIGGTERALISLEDLAPNRVLVEFNERYGRKVEVAKVFSQKEGYRALTLMEKKKDGQLIVSVPTASGQIPLIILMKSLGMEKDEDIYNAFVSTPEMANIIYANIVPREDPVRRVDLLVLALLDVRVDDVRHLRRGDDRVVNVLVLLHAEGLHQDDQRDLARRGRDAHDELAVLLLLHEGEGPVPFLLREYLGDLDLAAVPLVELDQHAVRREVLEGNQRPLRPSDDEIAARIERILLGVLDQLAAVLVDRQLPLGLHVLLVEEAPLRLHHDREVPDVDPLRLPLDAVLDDGEVQVDRRGVVQVPEPRLHRVQGMRGPVRFFDDRQAQGDRRLGLQIDPAPIVPLPTDADLDHIAFRPIFVEFDNPAALVLR